MLKQERLTLYDMGQKTKRTQGETHTLYLLMGDAMRIKCFMKVTDEPRVPKNGPLG